MSTRYPHKKYAWATVTSAPSPALSGVTVGMDSLSNLPSTYPYPATLVPNPATTTPTDANTEEVMVTATPGSTNLTITRAISGDAVAVDANYQLIAGITPKVFLEIEAELDEIAVDIDALDAELAGKADAVHTHDDRYYTEAEVAALLNDYALAGHNHDSLYYTEEEIDILLSDIENHSHTTGEITALAEYIRDTIGNTLVAGSNIALNVDDETDGITISSLASTAYQDWLNAGNSGSLQDFLDSLVGPEGDAGPGVPAGGTTGQALVKNSDTDYDTEWTSINSATWGNITGTLADQTDLQTVLDGKADDSHTHTESDITDLHTHANKTTLDAITAAFTTADETKLDGIEAGAEVNTVESLSDLGVTATASELNNLDGITATVTELNYTDGVTSAIQTQLDTKVTGPASATGDTIAVFDSTTGKLVKEGTNFTISANTLLGASLTAIRAPQIYGTTRVRTDEVSEWTSNTGVTIETVLIKDGLINGQDPDAIPTVSDTEPSSPADGDVWIDKSTTSDIVTTGGTQTLTNKTIDGDDNTLQDIPASAMKSEEWTSYTPSWSGASSNPSLGNGTIEGRYTRIGRTIIGYISLRMGSTTTYGSGAWAFSLPATPRYLASTHISAGTTYFEDSGTKAYDGGMCRIIASGAFEGMIYPIVIDNGGDGWGMNATSTTPFTWSTNDYLTMSFTYEAAA